MNIVSIGVSRLRLIRLNMIGRQCHIVTDVRMRARTVVGTMVLLWTLRFSSCGTLCTIVVYSCSFAAVRTYERVLVQLNYSSWCTSSFLSVRTVVCVFLMTYCVRYMERNH